MSSYVTNPSKKVTEILSRFLEFDPEQLKLGIWSGNLSLSDVELRQDAVYPLLNRHLNSARDEMNDDINAKPPVRFKLISGKIGSLQVKIPWKRLVWGNGDVKAEMRNVTLVVSLESRDETEVRENNAQTSASNENTATATEQINSEPTAEEKEEARKMREIKQNRLRDAEKRHLQGKSLALWLESMKKQDEAEMAKAAKTDVDKSKDEKQINKWLQNATSDFFWRFYAGLEMKIENVKIVLVQDGVEIGIVIPSSQIVAKSDGDIQISPLDDEATESVATPPQDIVYESEFDDGEHVDKVVKNLGVGLYIRKVTHQNRKPLDSDYVPRDVSAKEYLLRPVDFSFSFSLFYPYPLERQRKRKKAIEGLDHAAQKGGSVVSESASLVSSKKRRGKRDRRNGSTMNQDVATLATDDDVTGTDKGSPRQSVNDEGNSALKSEKNTKPNALNARAATVGRTGGRRMSMVAPLPASTAATEVLKPKKREFQLRDKMPTVLPLAEPDDLRTAYMWASSEKSANVTRLEGKLSVGMVQIICNTKHCHLLNNFMSATNRVRNGRPSATIKSVLVESHETKRLLTVDVNSSLVEEGGNRNDMSIYQTPSSMYTNKRVRLELGSARSERSRTVKTWWNYVLSSVLWEIRRRNRLRDSYRKTYLDFDWERQCHKRVQYVNLYISTVLQGDTSDNTMPENLHKAQIRELFEIEDELPIEQILLYRSIARSVHVRGGVEMPSSLRGLTADGNRKQRRNNTAKSTGRPLSRQSSVVASETSEEELPGLLASVNTACETIRKRYTSRAYTDEVNHSRHFPLHRMSNLDSSDIYFDDKSYDFTADSHTIKTFRSSKSRFTRAGMHAILKESMSSTQTSRSLLAHFSFCVDAVEVMLVDDDTLIPRYDDPYREDGKFPQSSSTVLSEISALTEDHHNFESDDSYTDGSFEEESDPDPVMASTDFLLFRAPENVVLRTTIKSLDFSIYKRSGGTQNVNLSIGAVKSTSERGYTIFSVGSITDASNESNAPQHETHSDGAGSSITASEPAKEILRQNAISISYVSDDNNGVLQCDTACLKICADMDTLDHAYTAFFTGMDKSGQILNSTTIEETRLFVLQQKQTKNVRCVDYSLRIHGIDMFAPISNRSKLVDPLNYQGSPYVYKPDSSHYYDNSSVALDEQDGVRLRIGLLEGYSGEALFAVTGLEQSLSVLDYDASERSLSQENSFVVVPKTNKTRRLTLIDSIGLLSSKSNTSCQNWIFTASSINIHTTCMVEEYNHTDQYNLFDNDINIEVFVSQNTSSALHFNRAALEVILDTSPMHLLVSENRISPILNVIKSQKESKLITSFSTAKRGVKSTPPRLEVLSRDILLSLDVSIRHLRASVIADNRTRAPQSILTKESVIQAALVDFLNVVGCFDLRYPHEEALSSSMQICIDRLVGTGFALDDAWEMSNALLLLFLEKMTSRLSERSQAGTSETTSVAPGSLQAEASQSATDTETTIRESIDVVVEQFSHIVDKCRGKEYVEFLVLDFPSGISMSNLVLHYDCYFVLKVPSLFVTDSAGIHILRVTPPEDNGSSTKDGSDIEKSSDKPEETKTDNVAQIPSDSGVVFRRLNIDVDQPFGRGGSLLNILGDDYIDASLLHREMETLYDTEIGDVEVLFSNEVFEDIIMACSSLIKCLLNQSIDADNESENLPLIDIIGRSKKTVASYRMVSVLFLGDEFIPFCRVSISDAVCQLSCVQNCDSTTTSMFCKHLSLSDLTKDGEMYPFPLAPLSSMDSLTASVVVTKTPDGSNLRVELRGYRLFYLKRLISEFVQFFSTEEYGMGRLVKVLKAYSIYQTDAPSSSSSSKFSCSVALLDSSVLIPQSSCSAELIAIEAERLCIDYEKVLKSFVLPTKSNPLEIDLRTEKFDRDLDEPFEFQDCFEDFDSRVEGNEVPRLSIVVHGARIYSSGLSETITKDHGYTYFNNPAIRYYFFIDGRAEQDKDVYNLYPGTDTAELSSTFPESKTFESHWNEITVADTVDLAIVIEIGERYRVLITDMVDGNTGDTRLKLNVPQYSLLLSMWYRNMKELPVAFPYPLQKLVSESTYASDTYEPAMYGSEDWLEMLILKDELISETAVVFGKLSVQIYDDLRFIRDEGLDITLDCHNLMVHVANDGSTVSQTSVTANVVELFDKSKLCKKAVSVCDDSREWSWPDHTFGMHRKFDDLSSNLPQAFQMTIYVHNAWKLFNLGLEQAFFVMTDLSSIFTMLDFVTSYFKDEFFGNPSFQDELQVNGIKMSISGGVDEVDSTYMTNPIIDFRLWLRQPVLNIPCGTVVSNSSPGVRIACDGGLWYRYTSFDDFWTQEVVSDDASLYFDNECAHTRTNCYSSSKDLVKRLSFGLRIDFNDSSSHSDISFKVPFTDPFGCSLISPRIEILPPVLESPTICTSYQEPHRYLGPKVCELTAVVEVIPATFSALMMLFSSGSSSSTESSAADGSTSSDSSSSSSLIDSTLSYVVSVKDMRIFVLDPLLGAHLPVSVLSLASLLVASSKFQPHQVTELRTERSPPEDQHVLVQGHFWIDYFKLGFTRSWEPLIEAYRFRVMYEKSRQRGDGISFLSADPLHFNISGAFLLILDEAMVSLGSQVTQLFHNDNKAENQIEDRSHRKKQKKNRALPPSISLDDIVQDFPITHHVSRPLKAEDRVAFSFRNMSGQKIRIFRPASSLRRHAKLSDSSSIFYLTENQSTEITFRPTISKVLNMVISEVDYPGLENSVVLDNSPESDQGQVHCVSIQLPGFLWLNNMKVDTFGRSFENITPKSEVVMKKCESDWRIENAMKILLEVGLDNGGREVTIRSLYSIINKTSHDLHLTTDPNPESKIADDERAQNAVTLSSGEVYQIPTLLSEAALHIEGHHLGSAWMKPVLSTVSNEVLSSFIRETKSDDTAVTRYCTRPIQLSKIVKETATLFENNNGNDISTIDASSDVQISCPMLVTDTRERLAPFCYAVEVGRSPVVSSLSTRQNGVYIHGPVSYELSIHPPLVITNLLPERGRFELMHAVRRNVLWFADLNPGQKVSIHSVGLDAPLLLLVNLGFCRTPVGEGALIHHGSDPPMAYKDSLGGLKSIGKAGKAVTKQIGKTLISLGDSPDRRVQEKLKTVRNHRFALPDKRKLVASNRSPSKSDRELQSEDPNNSPEKNQAQAKTYRVDSTVFNPEDVAIETTVVDSLGQRLALNIENVRGGGGQRRISIFCPFWIVNTTEHALRYRQENSKSFVCGTVISPVRDGSLPLSGGRAQSKYNARHDTQISTFEWYRREGTIFSGTSGALATSLGRTDMSSEDISRLLDKNLPLEQLAKYAFMFNFHEGVLSLAQERLCVQLCHGKGENRYTSDWSRGFSLDSVGFSHIVSIHCKDGRSLELSAVVSVAPGPLSGYTKIVRFLPRYVLVNCLSKPLRLWQDSSIFRPTNSNSAIHSPRDVVRRDQKWRFTRDKQSATHSRVNQYESLWGRQAVLDEGSKADISALTTAHSSARYIATAAPNELIPFCLPDSRGDRQLRVGVDGAWNLSASVSADTPGENSIKITKAVDLRLIRHVSTRASSRYEVRLPPPDGGPFSNELGIWFETEWGSNRSLIVKAVKRDSFAYNQTDVHEGDELLFLDDLPVSRMTFAEAMTLLKDRLAELKLDTSNTVQTQGRRSSISMMRRSSLRLVGMTRTRSGASNDDYVANPAKPLVLVFRTVEERLRRVRQRATRNGIPSNSNSGPSINNSDLDRTFINELSSGYLRTELRTIYHTLFFIIREDMNIPYKVENWTTNHNLYYRQKGCNGHEWQVLKPGHSSPYTWEEPLKPRRLQIRVADASLLPFTDGDDGDGAQDDNDSVARSVDQDGMKRLLGIARRKVRDEEESVFSSSLVVRLDEIGFRDFLPVTSRATVSKVDTVLEVEVDVAGPTRVLNIHDISDIGNEALLRRHISFLQQAVVTEDVRKQSLGALRSSLKREISAYGYEGNVELLADTGTTAESLEKASILMDDFPQDPIIRHRHQLLVEVIEATGLQTDSLVGYCSPYAEIDIKSTVKKKNISKKRDIRRTYFVKKTTSPVWNSQQFVFDVPADAVDITRGHCVNLKIRNYRGIAFSSHTILGRATVDLHCVRDQKPLLGWFPLSGRAGKQELENTLSNWGRGSVKLKIQWIYSVPALLEYFFLLSENRLVELQNSIDGMSQHLENIIKSNAKKKQEDDGLKVARINEILNRTPYGIRRKHTLTSSASERIINTRTHRGLLSQSVHSLSVDDDAKSQRKSLNPVVIDQKEIATKVAGMQKSISVNILELEEKIHRQRKTLQENAFSNSSDRKRRSTLVGKFDFTGEYNITTLKSWTAAQALCNHSALEIVVGEDELNIHLASSPSIRLHSSDANAVIPQQRRSSSIHKKLDPPSHVPLSISRSALAFTDRFVSSRESFERSSHTALKAVLNPGGWLTIRPLTALNLPDSYTGMFVRLRYGQETIISETVDAKVYPTWSKNSTSLHENVSGTAAAEIANDLHVYVSPQRTSGSIRLSVIGEKPHQRLNTKVEIGVLQIPLGAAILSCIDCCDESTPPSRAEQESVVPYVRWFPLLNPKDSVPVEGDRGMSHLPVESEKESDHLFQEYFAPCIHLALFWRPDNELIVTNDAEGHSAADIYLNNNERPNTISNCNAVAQSLRSPYKYQRIVESYFNADLACISAALIDSQRAFELASLSATDVDIRYCVTKSRTRMGLAIGWIQVDNQHENAREPIILAPTPNEYTATVLQILANKDNVKSKKDVLTFQYIDVSLAEFDLTIEETFLFDLFDFVNSVIVKRGKSSWSRSRRTNVLATKYNVDENVSLFNEHTATDEKSLWAEVFEGYLDQSKKQGKVYIEQLFLGVVKINLSYIKGRKHFLDISNDNNEWADIGVEDVLAIPRLALDGGPKNNGATSVHHEKSDEYVRWTQQTMDDDRISEGLNIGASSLPSLITTLFPNVSDAPVRLQGKALNHVFESPIEIFQSIKKFYANETLRQIYKIIGSLDFVGNPTMLLSSFSSGLRDLIYTPFAAFNRSPTDLPKLGLGVLKGALSLLSHSASGFFGFAAKVTATAGQGLATLSLDSDYRIWHREKIMTEATNLNREWKRRGMQSMQAMVARPIEDIALGLGSAVVGVFVCPIKGYRRDGNLGLVKGVAIGVVGTVTKPTVGVLDALTHFTASIHDIAKSVNVLDKRYQPAIKYRLPYRFGAMNILESYNPVLARASYLLKQFPLRKHHKGLKAEVLVHAELLPNMGTDTFVIVSSSRILLIKIKKEISGGLLSTLSWEVHLFENATISTDLSDHGHNGVALSITTTKSPQNENVDANPPPYASHMSSLNDTVVDPAQSIRYSSQRVNDFRLGSGRGKKGEMLEWVTILAEYQFRPQLARLHNVICCLVGDFEKLITDSSLGHKGSTEGYTSFGIFFFEPENDRYERERRYIDSSILLILEQIPWVDEAQFASAAMLTREEQIKVLSELREQQNAKSVFQTPQIEESQDWLTRQHNNSDYERDRWESSTDFPYTGVPNTTAIDNSDLQHEESESSSDTMHLLKDQLHSPLTQNADLESPVVELKTNKGDMLLSADDAMQIHRSQSRDADDSPKHQPSVVSALTEKGQSVTEIKIDRMESLMERLLIFSSEQALQNHEMRNKIAEATTDVRSSSSVDTEQVRQELRQVQLQMQAQLEKDTEAQKEIEALRQEIAKLRGALEQLSTTTNTTTSGPNTPK